MSNGRGNDPDSIEMDCSPVPSEVREQVEEERDEIIDGDIIEERGLIAVRGNIPHQFEPPARPRDPNQPIQRQEDDIYRGRRENLDW